jgi:protease-4
MDGEAMNEPQKKHPLGKGGWFLLTVLPLIGGLLISLFIPRPVIGIITLNDAIYDLTAEEMVTQLSYAYDHPEVRAVVIAMNSPGGTVTDTESVYMEIARLRKKKPVITLINSMAASGAYYLAVGTDYIIAKPSSEVGNVGVWNYLPFPPSIEDDLYSTGPYKLWGSPRDTVIRQMEMIKKGFLDAVVLGRGDSLKTAQEVILRGQIYPGSEALRMGLIDELGSQSMAFEKAADLAHIQHYKISNLRQLAGLPEFLSQPFFITASDGRTTPYPLKSGVFLLYIPNMEERP